MKKVVVILLMLMYGAASVGATVQVHYCMDELVGWSWGHAENKACGKCGMKEKKGGCCKDEDHQLKLKTEHQKGDASVYFQLQDIESDFYPVFSSYKTYNICLQHYPVCNAPPDLPKKQLYILHAVFLI